MNILFSFKTLLIFSILSVLSCSSNVQLAKQEGSGFGGTGIIQYTVASEEDSSGFGGTGIIGNIEAFGSIWVNGIEIDYDDDVKINSNLNGADKKLKLGQSVFLQTDEKLNEFGRPFTNQINVYYPLAGAIQIVEATRLKVNEQWVNYDSKTHKDQKLELLAGQYIAINATQDQHKNWQASRLNYNPAKQTINQAEVTFAFSKDIKRVIMDERLDFMRQHWRLQSDFMLPMNRSRIDRRTWQSMSQHNDIQRMQRDNIRPMTPPHIQREQLNQMRDMRSPRHMLPPPIIRQEYFRLPPPMHR